jgi:hypothetical protein
MSRRSATSLRSLLAAALDHSPSGRTTTSLAREVGSNPSRVAATRLAEMQSQGRVIGVVPEVTSGRETKLWFAPQYAQQAAAAGPIGWAKAPQKRTPPKRATIAKALAPEPVTLGAEVRRVSAPVRRDTRYTVDPAEVRPVFSGQRPGQYTLASGSCVARAYGER